MQENSAANFQSTKAYDVLIAAPLVLFYGFSLAGLRPQFEAALNLRPAWVSALQLAALASSVPYFALIILLVFLRRMPLAKSRQIWPRALALVSSNLLVILAVLPRVTMPAIVAGISAALVTGSSVAEVIVLFWLGRSFSILPEARRLVMRGPYRHIRHPLYLAGFIGSFGVMLQFVEPWAALLVVAALLLQLWRMHYEEQVLTETFPEYSGYVARSWRLLPFLY